MIMSWTAYQVWNLRFKFRSMSLTARTNVAKYKASSLIFSWQPIYISCMIYMSFSSLKIEERVKASKVLTGCTYNFTGDQKEFLEHLRKALYASKVISYAQGFMLLREAAKVSRCIVSCFTSRKYIQRHIDLIDKTTHQLLEWNWYSLRNSL